MKQVPACGCRRCSTGKSRMAASSPKPASRAHPDGALGQPCPGPAPWRREAELGPGVLEKSGSLILDKPWARTTEDLPPTSVTRRQCP